MNTQEKDIEKFIEIYEKYKFTVFETALNYCNLDYHLAEEIVQDTFVTLHLHFDEKKDSPYLKAWLKSVAKNKAINYEKLMRKAPSMELLEETMPADEYESMDDKYIAECEKKADIEKGQTILEALYEKNKRWYIAVSMVYGLGKTQQEFADEMGVSLNLVKCLMKRAKSWIKKNYSAEDEDTDETENV